MSANMAANRAKTTDTSARERRGTRVQRSANSQTADAGVAPSWTERSGLVYAAVVVLAVVVYLNCLPNQVAYDDDTIIARNARLESPFNFRQLWLTDWWYVSPGRTEERHRDRLYRPLVMQSFALNYAVSGTNTWSYHAADIVLHATFCALLVAFGRIIFRDTRIVAWGAILFAVLPIHTESVAYLVGRADVLCALFCLLGVYCLARELNTPKGSTRLQWRIAALVCVPLGLFCKEQAVCLPGLLILTEWYLRNTGRTVSEKATDDAGAGRSKFAGFLLRRFLGFYFWTLVAFCGYLALRYVALDGHLVRDVTPSPLDNPFSDATNAQRIWSPFKLLAHYVVLTVWPANLCSDYSFDALPLSSSPADPLTLIGVLLVAGTIWACVSSWRGRRTVLFNILFFAISYALISNTVLIIGTICGERLFYLPSASLCWLLAIPAARARDGLARAGNTTEFGRRLPALLGWTLVAALGVRTIQRTFDWRDGPRLFAVDVLTRPNSARLLTFHSRDLIEQGDLDGALGFLTRSLAIFPEYADAHALTGYIHAITDDWPTAEKHYYLSLQLLPENPKVQAQFETFRSFYEGGGTLPREALARIETAVATQPANTDLLLEYGDLLAAMGKYREAIKVMTGLLEERPDDFELRFRLSNLLIIDEQADEAEDMLRSILAENPDDWRAHSHLAMLMWGLEPDLALRHARRAVELEPMRFEARMNLAQTLAVTNRTDEALGELRRLLSMLSADEPARMLVERQIQTMEEHR